MNERSKMLVAAWCGPLATVLLITWVWSSGHYLPEPASSPPDQIVSYIRRHDFGFLFGCTAGQFAVALMTVWMSLICVRMAKIEGGFPLWAVVQGIAASSTLVFFALGYLFWILAAFRVDTLPAVAVNNYDAGFMAMLIPWPEAGVQMITLALVSLADKRDTPLFPRWLSKLSFVFAAGLIGASGIAFNKTGLFAYHGLLGYYIPFLCFGAWMDLHSFYLLRAVLRGR